MSDSPISGTFAATITGTYVVATGTTDVVVYEGATFGNGSPAVLVGGGTLESSGSVTVNFDYGAAQLELGGGITWENGGTVNDNGILQFGTVAGDSATIVNETGAVFDLTSGNSDLEANGSGTYAFINDGTLEQTVNSNNSVAEPLTNAGLVSSDSGNLYLDGPTTNSGTIQSDGGFLELQGGVLGGTIQSLAGNIALVGTYNSAIDTTDTVMFGGAYLGWGGDGAAVLAGPGTLLSNGNVTIDFDYGSPQVELTGGVTLDNAGTINDNGELWFGTGTADATGATIVNQTGALFDLTSGNSDLSPEGTGSYSFVNDGTLEQTVNSSNSVAVPLTNAGLVSGDSGNLYLDGPVSNSGTIQSDGGFVEIRGGVLGGTIQDVSGNIALVGTYSSAINTAETVDFGGAYLGWTGDGDAVLAGPGTLVSTGSVTVDFDYGTPQVQLADGITWDNAGTVYDNGVILFGTGSLDSATLVNQAGDLFDLTSGNSDLEANGAGSYVFDNYGTLEQTVNATNYIYVPLINNGLVSGDSGALELEGPVTNNGTIQSDDASVQLYGGVLGGTIQSLGTSGGVALVGTYTLGAGPTDAVTFDGAILGSGGADAVLAGGETLVSHGAVSVTFDYGTVQLQLADGVTWDNDGAITDNGVVQFGAAAGDSATLVNEAGAVFNLTSGNSDLDGDGSGTYAFDNIGTLEETGNNTDYVYVPLDNSGLVTADTGALELEGAISNSGTIQADGGSVELYGGVLGGTIQSIGTTGQIALVGTYVSAASPGGIDNSVTFGGAVLGLNGIAAVLVGPGTLTTDGSESVTFDYGTVQLQLADGITWDNAGTLTDNGVVQFGAAAGDSATLVNEANAVINLTSGNSDLIGNGTGAYLLDNEGILEETGNNNDSISVPLDNSGLVVADTGTLSLNGPVTNSGTIEADGGSVDMAGGVLGGTLEALSGNVVLGGTYTSAADTTDTVAFDNVTLTGAVMAGPGTLASSGNAAVTFDYGTVEQVLTDGITWENSGSLTINGIVQFGTAAGDSATLVNESGAVINLTQGGGSSNLITGGAGTYTLVNDGLLEQTVGGSTSIDIAIDDTSTGTIDAADGSLTFTAGGTIAGLIEGSNTVNFNGGNVTLAATGDITVNTINFDPNTLYMNGGTISSPNLSIAAGDEVIGYGTLDNVDNNGTIIAQGGVLVITGSVTGSGVFETGPGGVLEFTGTVAGTYTNTGVLELNNDATLTTTAGFINSGDVYVNNTGSGGGALTVGGTLTNSNYIQIGDDSLATTVTAQGLDNTGGRIDLDGGNATEQATLSIAAGAPATWTGVVNIGGYGLLEYGGTSGIGTIASGAQINLFSSQGFIAASGLGTTSDSALTGLTTNDGQLQLQDGASLTTTGDLANSGGIYVNNGGSGGSSLTIDGTLTNSNFVQIGDDSLATTVTAQGLDNNGGRIDLDGGSATERAVLNIAADAPATWTGVVNIGGYGLLEYGGSSGIGTIASGAQINLFGAQAFLAASGLGTTSDSALTGLTTNDGQLELQDGSSLTTTGDLANSGGIYVNNGGSGGSSLTIDGTLTNSNFVQIGDDSLATTVTAQGLDNAGGRIDLDGGDATERAVLNIAADAPATWTGVVNIGGYGLLEYGGSSGIGTIASGAQINIFTSQGFIAASGLGTTSNSALAGLTANDGQLQLQDGVALAITGDLTNSGNIFLDNGGNGGSSVTIGGTLTNGGNVYIGTGSLPAPSTMTVGALVNTGYLSVVGNYGSATAGATLDVNTVAGFGTAGVLTGSVFIDGYGVIEFTGGQIGTIAGGATLELRDNGALADDGDLGSNSALTGLTVNDGVLAVRYGDHISLTGNLLNAGNIYLQDEDSNATVSVNTIAGTLTNSGNVYIGSGGLTAPTTLTVGALVNTGYLSVVGNYDTATAGATLDVNTIAGFGTTGVLTGSVFIDGYGVIAFTGGQIGTIASGASLELRASGELADAGHLGSSSALTGLTENDGNLIVRYGDQISLSGNLLNAGHFYLQDEDNNTSVSVNTIAGTLTNTGGVYIGNLGLTAPTTLTVGALVNTGNLDVVGNDTTATQGATLDVNTIAGFGTTGVLTGSVYIDGNGVIEFTGGQIGTIASGAVLELRYLGELADAGNLGSNSALTGLTVNDGILAVRYGDQISLTGNLLNAGNIYLEDEDNNSLVTDDTIAGTLTNSGQIFIGNSGLTAPTTLTVGALVNSNYLNVAGNAGTPSDGATVTVNGAASSSGSTNIEANATLDVTGGNTYSVTGGDTDVSGLLTAGTIAVDGGELQLSGGSLQAASLTIASGATLLGFGTVQPAITSDGIIEASGGSLDLQGGLAVPATVAIENGSALELAGADSGVVDFAGPNGTFVLDDPVGFTGTIDGLALGDTLVLNDTTATVATPTFDSATDTSTLAITLAGGGTIDLTLAGNYAGETFAVNQAGTSSEVAPIGTAAGTIVTPTPIDFGEVHTGATVTQPLDIMNNGPTGAASLDVSIGALSGDATGSGHITGLAPRASDATDISVGINTQNAGTQTGTVTLDFASDVGGGNTSPLPSQSVGVSGTVYGYADPSITAPSNLVLHVGDDGGTATVALTVANIAPTNGYYEGLEAAANGTVTGNLTGASGSTGDIAAGGSNTSSVTVSFSTATAGYVSGTAVVALTSDGTGVDTLGLTSLDGATYSAVTNFSTVSNANGVWSYLSNGTLLADASSGSGYERWGNGGSIPNNASILENTTTTTETFSNTIHLPPNYLNLDPESVGNIAVQFTAPTAGVYTFTGGFLGTDSGENSHTVAVVVNGTTAESGTISSFGQTLAIGLTETLAAGATVDFVSDSGASYNNLSVGLAVTVTTANGAAVPVSAVIDNYATAAIQQTGSVGLLGQVGNTYTLDLGTFASGIGTVSDTLDVANTAAGPADWLSGDLTASGDAAISDTGLGAFGTLGAGGTTPFSVDLSTTNSGVFSQTITLAATDSNASGYSEALAGETIDVVGTVLSSASLAKAVINTTTPIVLADAHVATGGTPTDLTDLSISNTGSAALSASVGGFTGTAYGTGSFSQLAAGGTDTTGIAVGVDNTSAGAKSGDVTIDFQSGANLLTNGSFEDTAGFVPDGHDAMQLAPGSTTMQGWTVIGGNPLTWIGPTNTYGVSAEDGGYFLDLTGDTDHAPYAGVSQTIATTIGDHYQLSFELGSSTIWGLPDSLTASAAGTSETFTTTATGSNNWQTETLDFTATGASTTISLLGASPSEEYIGVDNVSVTRASDTPPVGLNPQTVAVSGDVYRLAAASITGPSNVILHVGDGGGTETEALTVANTDPADGFSEGLEATAVGSAGGDVSGASGATGDIAAQGTNDTALTVSISTTSAATGGTVAVAETSDGAGVDTLGTTSLGTVDVAINVAVNNYATAAMEKLGGDGTLTPSGVANTYTLDLGTTEQYSSPLTADLGALNAALGPAADLLDGNFAISGDSEYADSGFGPFSGVSFGNADGGNDVVLNTGTVGTFTQQIVLTPTGTNASGYSGTLSAETIDVVGTIVPVPPPPPPPLPVAVAWGDVHLTTFDGLYYNFQAEGEFVLAQSTVAGDTFQVQARLQPWSAGSTVSVMSMLAAEVGTDRVTFGLGRTNTVWVGGAPVTFGGDGSSIALSGGTVTQITSTSYQVTWNTGEVMDVTDGGTYFNMSLTLSAADGPGSIQGLLGSDSGQANDFVANGTVLPQPLSSATLYGEFADAWRVTDTSSLMDYLAGQHTATFTDVNFPADSISPDSLPAAVLAEAEQEVIQAGITDPNLQAAAIVDLLVTGDPNSLLNDLNINQNGEVTDAAVINTPPPPVPALGVSADATNVVENAGGTTTVTYTAYLTNATGTDTVIDWAVTAPNNTFLGATSFGGTLPSGFVVIPAGQTTTNFTVTLPTGVLGSTPSSNLQVTIASTNGDPIFGQTAQTEIDNFQPVAGNPAVPVLTLLSGAGTFSGSDGNYTLNLGTLAAGEQPVQDRLQFSNDALAPSDLLTGSITASGSGFTVYGDEPLTALAAGASYQGLVTETESNATGVQTETIVFTPVDENITGYSSIMPSQTLTITETVLPAALGDLLTNGPINLGTFYEGMNAQTTLSIENAASAGSAGLDVTTANSGNAIATGAINDLAPGASNSSSIMVGIDTSTPGVQTGTITLNYASDAGNGNTAADGSQQIEVIGTVYGPADPSLTAQPIYVHYGADGGTVSTNITVSNTAPANGYSEDLIAQIVGFGPYATGASGSVEVAPGFSNFDSLQVSFSTDTLGVYTGIIAVELHSDGTGIDSEGVTSLGTTYVPVTVDVDQYAVAAMEELSGNGTMVPTGVATNYELDLGTVAQYATPLGANLGVLNDVLGQADLLGGSFTISGAPEFENVGFTPFGSGTNTAGLTAQEVDSNPVVVLSSGTVGTFSETITLDPIGYNPGGYSGTLTPITVTITGTVVAAPPPVPASRVSDAWGDVHLTTFDGLFYNFQAQGEFVLSESTIPGDTFAIQSRMQPWSSGSDVSVNTMVAAEIGNDRVTFAIDRADTVWIDGVAQTMSSPVINLADGTLVQTAANSYELSWNTGEQLYVTDDGSYLNVTVSLPNSDAGKVQGLLGNDNGNPNDDLALPGGAPITTDGTITYAELYGQYANAWRVTDSTSLMDYGPGQDTASFTNVNFPYNQIGLGNLPANAVAEALAAAEAAGITDPNLQLAAIEDYLFTGNPDALAASANVQQQEGTALSTAQTLTAPPPVATNIGIEANVPTMIESDTIAESVGFTIYLTSPEATATTVDFAVTDPGPGYLNAADFGGILPSGTVTIQAGETTALFTVDLPAAVLGNKADENLQVTISPTGGETVFAPQAVTEILNTGPTAGNPAQPVVEDISGVGTLTGGGTSYVLNLGTAEQYANPLEAGYGVLNDGIIPADLLSGNFVVNGSSQFLNSGLAAFDPIAAGTADTAPEVELLTNQVGTFTETVVLTPTDSNATGYSAVLNQVTLEVTGTIVAPPPPPPPPVSEATAWGDVHLTTFDGVYYNFQAAGEYVLTRSTVAGDTFQVQARLVPWGANSSVTVQTQVGAAIGSDDVVFALTGAGYNASPLYLNGTAEALGVGQTLTLSDGSVTETSDNTYRVNWDTGEVMTVTLNGSYISDTIELTAADAGAVQGLLGPDDGNAATDLQLPDGQSIAANGTITSSALYGEYASDWQVPNTASSLLYYTAGQSPSSFVIPGFPEDALTLSQLPANLVAAAEAIVEAEGITNPNLIDAAVIDLLVTGDPNSVFSSENVQEEGVLLRSAAVSTPVPLPSVGVMADATSALEPSTGTLAVDYTIYLTAASSQTSTIDYSVTGSGPNYLGTADIVGGTGSGIVQIAAGQTSVQIVVDVLAGALGSQPDAELRVGVTATGGESLFGGTAETEIVNPTPTAGNPAVALIEQLSGDGHLTGSGTSYFLNLGTQVQNGPDLYANLGIENAATVPADDLSGQFSITNFLNYLNTGFDPFSSVAPGAADTEPVVSLNTGTIGVYTETVVLDPTDTNATGYSDPMNDVTLTVTGTIVPMPLPPPPPLPTATAWGDVHITDFDGLYYNFQAVGEFTLAKSTVAGDSFDVQIRTAQWSPGATVSVIDEVAAGIGSNAVTFGLSSSQPYAVMLNGAQATFTNGVLTLADGTVTEESPSTYVVDWNTGESMTVSLAGSYISTSVALAARDENGNVEGLLGYDNGVNNDFAPVVSGTTITTDQLYYGSGQAGNPDSLADYWRLTQLESLLYYAPGTDTANYTDRDFPADGLTFADLPTALQQEGLQEAIQAGITDPQLQQAAALDFIVTGNPDIVSGSQNVQQQGITTTDSDVTGATVTPALGVSADNAALVEGNGDLSVGFTVYLSAAEAQATTVDYAVTAPTAAYLGASAFGGTLPTGQVTIAAGQTSVTFSVTVPAGVLGAIPSSDLQVTITPTGGESVFAPSAQTTIVNNQVEPGTAAEAEFALLSGLGTLIQNGDAYTLNLGTLQPGGTVESLGLAIENIVAAGGNALAGTVTDSGSGFTVSGTGPLPVIAAGDSYQGLHVAVDTSSAGTHTETITFTPVDENASGFSADESPLTLTITDTVFVSGSLAAASTVTPNPVNFGIVHVGQTVTQALSVTNTAVTGSDNLDGSVGSATGAATTNSGSFSGLAAGQTNDTSMVIGLSTNTSGVESGTAVVSLESDGTGIDSNGIVNLQSQTIDVTGTVDNYATAAIGEISGGGTLSHIADNFTLNLGTLTASSSPVRIDLGIGNAATGVADLLSGNFSIANTSGVFVNNGDTAFSGLAAGHADIAPTITLSAGTLGTFTETITLHPTGSNASGYSGTLATETVTVTGVVVEDIVLTTQPDTVNGADNVTILAAANTLSNGDRINGGSGVNTLMLQGGGVFDLALPTTLQNIQVADATEGQGAAAPIIILRNGTALTLNLASAASNPQAAGAVIHGAANADVINLGAGNDAVYLGGTGETVNGGSGTDTFYVTAATIGATIKGGSGTNNLEVQGGGTAVMGSNITGMNNVYLLNAGTSYNFTANATSGLVIHAGADSDTITVGSASQTVIGSSGTLHVDATAANAGVAVRGGTGSNTLEITTGGTVALNSTDTSLTVELDVASTVLLPTTYAVSVDGSAGNDTVVATASELRADLRINGGGGVNTLALQGGGVFNLATPAALTNVQVVDATEGPSATKPMIYLRNGTDLTVNILSAATNPHAAQAVIHGAANDDVINLGAGGDQVYLGGTGETVNGGSGTDLFYVTAATIGATINGTGGGTYYVEVQGGGTAVMGSNITGISAVLLANAGTSYDFTANAIQHLAIYASTDSDTITVGNAGQSVYGSSGNLVVDATAAQAGVAVHSGSASNELDITTSGTGTLNSVDNDLTVQLSAANTSLTLDHMEFIHAQGSGGSDTIIAGAAGQVLTGGGANDTLEDAGHYGVTFQDTIAGIQGDTLADFSAADTIDITNLAIGSVTGTPDYTGGFGPSSTGTLAVPTGSGPIDIKLTGLASGGTFSATTDGHGGTFVTYAFGSAP